MVRIWVLVADSSQARVFSAKSPIAALEEVTEIEHPQGRLQEQDLVSDKQGRGFDRKGQGSHGMENAVDAKTQEMLEFVKHIGVYLESASNQQKFERLVVVAAPAILGLLRDNMPISVSRRVSQEIDKNIVQLKSDEIRKHLPERL